MADRSSSQSSTNAAGMLYYTSISRSQINPGDKKTSTDYYTYGYRATNIPAACKTAYVNLGAWVISNTSEDASHYGSGLYNTTWLPSGYTRNPSTTSVYEDARKRALSKLISRVQSAKSGETSFDAGVFLAEGSKSLKMITNSATRIFEAYKALKRGRLLAFYMALGITPPRGTPYVSKKTARLTASNIWLEATLGWTPLLKDAYQGARALAFLVESRPPVKKITARASTGYVINTTGAANLGSFTATDRGVLKVEYGLEYTYSSGQLATLSMLGLTNPATIAWELFPLSFVLDWFLPIGDYLGKLGAFTGLEFSDGWLSAVDEHYYSLRTSGFTQIFSYGWIPSPQGTVWGVDSYKTTGSASYLKREFGFTRGRLFVFPSPDFPDLRLPKEDTFTKKCATAAALITQMVK